MPGPERKPTTRLQDAVRILSNACGAVAAALILISVLVTCQMIFVRGVLGQSTIWQTEAVIYMMIGATMIGLPYVQHQRGHVGVDLVPGLLSRGARKGLAIVVLIATLLMVATMTYYGWEMFHLAWERNWKSESVWAFPLWIPYLTVPFGFGVFALQLFTDLWLVATDSGDAFAANAHGISPEGENL